jgi:hypothetical protein
MRIGRPALVQSLKIDDGKEIYGMSYFLITNPGSPDGFLKLGEFKMFFLRKLEEF